MSVDQRLRTSMSIMDPGLKARDGDILYVGWCVCVGEGRVIWQGGLSVCVCLWSGWGGGGVICMGAVCGYVWGMWV